MNCMLTLWSLSSVDCYPGYSFKTKISNFVDKIIFVPAADEHQSLSNYTTVDWKLEVFIQMHITFDRM